MVSNKTRINSIAIVEFIKKNEKQNISYHVLSNSFNKDDPNYEIPDRNSPREEQRKWFVELCTKFIEEYVTESKDVDTLVQQMEQLGQRNTSQQYMCRVEGCDQKYVFHSIRVK